jgi:hypothetical protein
MEKKPGKDAAPAAHEGLAPMPAAAADLAAADWLVETTLARLRSGRRP